jgi:hypothetical protein
VNAPLDELYLEWLYSQVASVRFKNPQRTHWSLLRQLYSNEFVWFVPNDDNRAEDGRDLRHEFLEEKGISEVDPQWMGLGCSMLEMMIGLARRLSFEAEGEPRAWFWRLVRNLGLIDTNDTNTNTKEVNEIIKRVVDRTYQHNGHGGLFPLRFAVRDQRKVEIWYQLSAYLEETE